MCFQILVRFVERVLGGLTFRARYGVIFGLAGLVFGGPAGAQLLPWPAENLPTSENLTAIEGPGNNDFHEDLSAAVWNPVTRTLWR